MNDQNQQRRCYILKDHQKRNEVVGVLVTDSPTDENTVLKAWSYAVRYSAKGLDLPDYQAAIALMLERNPGWTVIPEYPITIIYNSAYAD